MSEQGWAKEVLNHMKIVNQRQFIIIILLIILNYYQYWHSQQWEYEEVTVEVETGIGNAIYNETGEVNYNAESEEDGQEEEKSTETEVIVE